MIISLKDIVKTYPMGKSDLTVLKGVNLNVETGEMVAIMGPSGSGKTTLLNIVGCLDRQTSGQYFFDGKDISGFSSGEFAELRGQRIGFIFQTFNLLSRLSALSNVELGMMYSGGVNRQRAREALEKVGLAARVKHRPIELSGGEQQRVAIARAIVKRPSIVLADEPIGNLDNRTGEQILELLHTQVRASNSTLIMASHSLLTCKYADRVLRMEDGKIVDEAPALRGKAQ